MFLQFRRRTRHWRHRLRVTMGRDVSCPISLRVPTESHGSDYGGWTIRRDFLRSDSIVYSAGIGQDITFDLSLIKSYGVTIHAFDPTPASLAWLGEQQTPPELVVHPVGLAGVDGTVNMRPPTMALDMSRSIVGDHEASAGNNVPVKRLSTLMQELGHDHIDLLKMDIEGAEYAVLEDLEASGIDVCDILLEVHHRMPGLKVSQTEEAYARLRRMGCQPYAVSPSGMESSWTRDD